MIKIPLASAEKKAAIEELVKLAFNSGKIADSVRALKDVMERESLMSTGIGKGIAIPHAKTGGVKDLTLALGICPDGIDFDSLDGEVSKIFFFVLSPPDRSGPHIQLLANISTLLKSEEVRNAMIQAGSEDDIYSVIKKRERNTGI
jgi:mannitol/fructose-specific phosphotransferase system IIA component (Ntr-type)